MEHQFHTRLLEERSRISFFSEGATIILLFFRISNTKRRYEDINDGDQKYSDDGEIVNFIGPTDLLAIVNVVSTVQNETNTNGNLETKENVFF